MLTALFIILMFAVFGKLILLASKASWGILKVLLTISIFPLCVIGLFVSGLVYICLLYTSHEVSYMKAVCGRVKTNVKSSFSVVDQIFDLCFVSYLGDQASGN